MIEENIEELHGTNCFIVNFILSTGQKGTIPLNKKQCSYFYECIEQNKSIILQVGDEIRTLNPDHISMSYVKGLYEKDILIKTNEIDDEKGIEPQKTVIIEEIPKSYKPKELFLIECKCGEVYELELPFYTQKNSCRKCNLMLFVDRKKGKQPYNRQLFWIMTNRYFVERQFSIYQTSNLNQIESKEN